MGFLISYGYRRESSLGGPVRWIEKRKIIWWRLLDNFRKRKAAKKKLTWWSQSEGWGKENSPGGHNRKVGEKKAHLVVTIRWLEKRNLAW
jgi:hypothetical protein